MPLRSRSRCTLQRLGCSIVYASFHRVTVATNKLELADAEEYIDFVISTAQKTASADDALSKISLRPRQFHSQFLFLDEYNYGTMHLERVPTVDIEENEWVIPEGDGTVSVVQPSVVTAWSVMDYLGSEMATEYFRVIIGRYSKDILKKQMEIRLEDPLFLSESESQLLDYKKKMVSKHLAHYLTRAVGEILDDDSTEDSMPKLMTQRPVSPALEFIKNVIVVLELDTEVDAEVQSLKRSLLSQLGVAEYAAIAQWKNPCPSLILPDVFCSECQDSRDVNVCYSGSWECEDCGTTYDAAVVERRLVQLLRRKVLRYQLQDLRDKKTNRVLQRSTHALSPALEYQPDGAKADVQLFANLAAAHDLDSLQDVATGILRNYRSVS